MKNASSSDFFLNSKNRPAGKDTDRLTRVKDFLKKMHLLRERNLIEKVFSNLLDQQSKNL